MGSWDGSQLRHELAGKGRSSALGSRVPLGGVGTRADEHVGAPEHSDCQAAHSGIRYLDFGLFLSLRDERKSRKRAAFAFSVAVR